MTKQYFTYFIMFNIFHNISHDASRKPASLQSTLQLATWGKCYPTYFTFKSLHPLLPCNQVFMTEGSAHPSNLDTCFEIYCFTLRCPKCVGDVNRHQSAWSVMRANDVRSGVTAQAHHCALVVTFLISCRYGFSFFMCLRVKFRQHGKANYFAISDKTWSLALLGSL